MAADVPFNNPQLKNNKFSFEWDIFHWITVLNEFSRLGSAGVLWAVFVGATIGTNPIVRAAKDSLRNEILPKSLAGEISVALAVSEPSAASDVKNITTSAKLEGDHQVVNGTKKWITTGMWAEYFTTAVRTGENGQNGISMLVIPRSEGVTTRQMQCTGCWSSGTAFVEFKNVKVPKNNLLGEQNKGFQIIMHNFNSERILLSAMSIGLARCAYEEAFK